MIPLLILSLFASSQAAKCIGWRQTGGCDPDSRREEDGDKSCTANIMPGSSGYCQCENGEQAGYVTCEHDPFTCQEACARTNVLGYMEDTVWLWNDWRNVEFRSGGIFFAPTDGCRDGVSCKWKVLKGDRVEIDWIGAGIHTVRLGSDRTTLQGSRYDGDPCSAVFRRRDSKKGSERHKKRREQNGANDDEEEGVELYEVLGVDPEAEESKIKKAYRKLSRKWHPDKNRNDPEKAAEMFEKIREAYEVIGNPDKRILYDTDGLEAVKEAEKEDNSGGGGGHDPFAAFFGGGQQQQGRQAKKGNDARVELSVSLEDMYNGNTVAASISRRVVCRQCKNGGKGKNRARCSKCGRCPNEVKTVMRQMAPGFNVQQQEEVPSKHRCKDESTTLNAVVEKGMDNNAEIKFERMSEQRPGMIPGDVIMVLKQKPHKRFRREGNDLHYDLVISLKQSLIGFETTIEHLDGHQVEISSHGRITKPFQVMHIKNEGMPYHNTPSQKGTLHVKITVNFPTKLSEEQRKFVQEYL
jgi:DnaJ-class molecular chaperone